MKADLKPPSTTERVLLIRKNAPYATQSDIAKLLGVTRERIRQILKKHGLPPVVKRPPKYHQCLYCGANILTKFYRRQYCDEHCRTLHLWGIYPCDVCGKDIAMRHKEYQHRRRRFRSFTCSYTCRTVVIRDANKTLWELHRKYVGLRHLNSSTLAIPLEIRQAHGFGQPSNAQRRRNA